MPEARLERGCIVLKKYIAGCIGTAIPEIPGRRTAMLPGAALTALTCKDPEKAK